VEKQVSAVDGPITGARAVRRGCFDRVVINLKGTAPGYRVRYVSKAAIGIPCEDAPRSPSWSNHHGSRSASAFLSSVTGSADLSCLPTGET
jgi:hypothetical protein